MKKILVVDDQPDNVFILKDRLEREGFQVISAYDGAAAIEKAKEEMPDLILLDVMMPDMSGFEVCEKISHSEIINYVPIILVTALTGSEDIRQGLQAGAYDYIKKPFNKIELIARVNSALKYSETRKLLLELEKVKTFAATVVTANHEIKQPLTLISLSTTAIRRELGKEEISKEMLTRRVNFIENASKEINKVLEKFNSIRNPEFIEYVNDVKMVSLEEEKAKTLSQ